MDKQNFLEWGNSPFSKRAFKAAHEERLSSAPLLATLERVHAITRGLTQICKIAQANAVQQAAWEEREEDDTEIQPPLALNTVESLLALGEVVSGMLTSEIESISAWIERHGISESADKDILVAAQASVTRSRAKKSPSTALEPEHA